MLFRSMEEIQWGPEAIDQLCVVKYDGNLYPGIIKATDELEAQVKCVHRAGENKFFWPVVDDLIWYTFENVIAFIPLPQPVSSRHLGVQKDIWAKLVQFRDD